MELLVATGIQFALKERKKNTHSYAHQNKNLKGKKNTHTQKKIIEKLVAKNGNIENKIDFDRQNDYCKNCANECNDNKMIKIDSNFK